MIEREKGVEHVIFVIIGGKGYNLYKISSDGRESEVLLEPERKFIVTDFCKV